MRKLKNVIVIIEPRKIKQVALERILSLVRFGSAHKRRIEITAIMPVYDFSWDMASVLSVEKSESLQGEIVDRHAKWLKAFLEVNAGDLDIDIRVVSSKNVGKEINNIAKEIDCDLIIKSSEMHGVLDSVIFTPLDWQLLRHAPSPVLIAKEHDWYPSGNIVVAVDLTDPTNAERRKLNLRLLREAQETAQLTDSQVHLVSAITPMVPPGSLDLYGINAGAIGEELGKELTHNVHEFARVHRISTEHCHIREGLVEDVIPEVCYELNPSILFIGTAARRGLAVAIMGNTCEKVIDDLDCDVAVLTPKAVKRREEAAM